MLDIFAIKLQNKISNMKKTALTLVCNLLIVAITVGAFSSCKKDKDEDKPENLIVKTWYLRSRVIKDYFGTVQNDNTYTGTSSYITFSSNSGVTSNIDVLEDVNGGTWQLIASNSKLSLSQGSTVYTLDVLTLTDGTLSIRQPKDDGNVSSEEWTWTFSKN